MRSTATGIANEDNPYYVIELRARRDDWDLGREQHHGQWQPKRHTSKAVHMTAPPDRETPCHPEEPLAIRVPSTHDGETGGCATPSTNAAVIPEFLERESAAEISGIVTGRPFAPDTERTGAVSDVGEWVARGLRGWRERRTRLRAKTEMQHRDLSQPGCSPLTHQCHEGRTTLNNRTRCGAPTCHTRLTLTSRISPWRVDQANRSGR